ncbi:glucokinase [Gallibacterium salpingitidis]|uniref:Glucokinase n=1 Tax=Gallibacterium salpingitidis TaxID=505341 RepID=A0AB36E6T0_9PAST|nr:ROK family protein [Gallibacterium salpingitidis]OBX09830.1 glucokinase [Gallibacterium salpingitidis]OBX11348.1 glucokinase [Gallibacterium salpingitidis]
MKQHNILNYYVGIDIGGTNTKIGIVDDKCNIIIEKSIKTLPELGVQKTFSRIWKTTREMTDTINISEDNIIGIGLGIPGLIINQSIIKRAANFPWGDNVNVKHLMEEITKKPVKVEKDVNNIALGEYLFGEGRGFKNILVISIGTGVSAGIIINHQILSGATGCGGEFGHIVINPNGLKCGCGLTGCLETYVSTAGLLREAKKLITEKNSGLISKQFQNNLQQLEVHHIFEFYKKDDAIAITVIENFCRHLAYGIGILLNIINPDAIIFAGGISKSADVIIEKVNKYLHNYALQASMENLQFRSSKLLDSAGIKGAAALIMNTDKTENL